MWCWRGEEERDAETTAERGGSEREFGSAAGPEVGGRLELVRGRQSLTELAKPKLSEEEGKERKDWPGAASAAGGSVRTRKDWFESRKE